MKRRGLITGTILLTMALLIVPFISGTEVQAKSKAEISQEKITMFTNESEYLKIKNASSKVIWSSTDEKIVKISEISGKRNHAATIVTGNKTGKCTIKAKIDGNVYKCKVTVKEGIVIKKYTGSTSKLSLEKLNISASSLSVRIKMSNASKTNKNEKYFGNAFYVKKYVDGKWKTLEMKNGNFTCEAYIISPKTSVSRTYNLSAYYDKALFTKGKYRIYVSCNVVKKAKQYVAFSL